MASRSASKTRKCASCGVRKPLLDFPTTDADECLACTVQKAAPASSEALPEPLASPEPTGSGDLFQHVDAEIDPASPTIQEMAARTLARRRLLPFIRRFRPKYQAGWVHEDICRRLERFVEAVERQEEPRLLLCVPVRHGKSEIGSRHFPAWVLGRHPDWEMIAASGASSLAMSFSRYLRDLLRDDSYQAVFPRCQLDPASQSVENWNTTGGGGYLAAGIGTMITGRGAHILLIDDAVKDAEAADSQTIRDNVWEWYISTALSRLAPGGGVLVIMTWWHDDDLAGRLQQLSQVEGADTFEVVKYPAINDLGDEYILPDDSIVQLPPGSDAPEGAKLTRKQNTALHAERYTLESLLKRKATYYAQGQQRWWAALYQQNPAPEEGAYFTKKMFRYYANKPHKLERNVYQAWDFAITEKQQADYIVGATGELDVNDNLHIVDIDRFRSGDSFVIADAMLDAWERHGSEAVIGVEDGQIWRSIEAVFVRRCQERKLYPSIEVMKPFTDKLVRAQPLRGRMQLGKVWFPDNAPWMDVLRQELLRFPTGKHDDQVDACFIAGTRVLMADGSERRIERVVPGDMVATPQGPCRVLDARRTGQEEPVLRVEFSDGRTLVGTAEHPVATSRGWVALGNLTDSDIIHVRVSIEQESSWVATSRKVVSTLRRRAASIVLSFREKSIVAIQILRTRICDGISLDQESSYTVQYGSSITASFRQSTIYTTRMRTTSTTTSATLNACPHGSTTTENTLRVRNTYALKNNASTWRGFVVRLRNGIALKLGDSGTQRMESARGKNENRTHCFAKSAADSSVRSLLAPDSAANHVRTAAGTNGTLTMVRRSALARKHAVYNLTVERAECYYANGVLVHNCAWLTRLVLSRQAPQLKKPKEQRSWKDRLKGIMNGTKGASHMAA